MAMETLHRDMQRLLNFPEEMEKTLTKPARQYVKSTNALFRTPADIYEYPNFYSFQLDMPGLEVSNIKVKVENGVLHVKGKKKIKKQKGGEELGDVRDEEAIAIRIERRRAPYWRKFTLPEDANEEDVKATYKDGVLTVNVAKKPKQESKTPKLVSIPIS